jgi:DNA-binding response OmpR family regulator
MVLERVGFGIDVFNDPLIALERFKPDQYGLVMLDVLMPRMNGFELYTKPKGKDPKFKVCFLTPSSETYPDELRERKYSQLSRDLFLEMPLPIKKIIAEIKKRIGIE